MESKRHQRGGEPGQRIPDARSSLQLADGIHEQEEKHGNRNDGLKHLGLKSLADRLRDRGCPEFDGKFSCLHRCKPDAGDDADKAPDPRKPHPGKTEGIDNTRASAEGPAGNIGGGKGGAGDERADISAADKIFIKGLPFLLSQNAEDGREEQ